MLPDLEPAVLPVLAVKTLRDWRRAATGWAAGLAVFALVYLGSWASLKDQPELLTLKTDTMPKGLSTAFGLQDMTTGAGYLQSTIYSLIGPLLLSMAGIVFGAKAVAGLEDRHVLDLLLANPISRQRFVWQRYCALLIVMAGLGLVLLVLPLLLSQTMDMGVSVVEVTAASVGLFALALLFATLSMAVGAATGRRATALGVAGTVAVAGYVIFALGRSVPWMEPLRWLSPFQYYLGGDPLHAGFHVGYLLILLAGSAVLAGFALRSFDRRDVRV
jgi:ABC-2 type transport system permease protein